jgi:MraZ protein
LIGQGNKFEVWDEDGWIKARDEWIDEEQSDEAELPPELGMLSL